MAVEVTTLGRVIGNRVVAGMKIDIEGAERLALLGAADLFAGGNLPLLQLEWNDASERNFGESRDLLRDLLKSYGYELARPDKNGELRREPDPRIGTDVFACPPGLARLIR